MKAEVINEDKHFFIFISKLTMEKRHKNNNSDDEFLFKFCSFHKYTFLCHFLLNLCSWRKKVVFSIVCYYESEN